MTSIFTGVSERTHRAGMINGKFYGISDSLVVLPEILAENGFSTYAVFNVVVMSPRFGFSRGFDFGEYSGCSLEALDADEVVDAFIGWMDSRNSSQRFFAVLHFFDPHFPYDPPDGFRNYRDPDYHGTDYGRDLGEEMFEAFHNGEMGEEGLQHMVDSYDGEIAFTDSEISRLLSWLRSSELADSTVVIVIADHGEEFGEHGMLTHGKQLYRETTGVPLIMSGPDIPRGVVDSTVVGQYDVLPTILSYLDLPVPGQVEGSDILNPDMQPDREIPCSGFNNNSNNYVAIRRNQHKLFWYTDADSSCQFDLKTDPQELHPGSADSSLIESALEYWATPVMYPAPEIPGGEEFTQKLRDLGYM